MILEDHNNLKAVIHLSNDKTHRIKKQHVSYERKNYLIREYKSERFIY